MDAGTAMPVQVAVPVAAQLGEGPRWDEASQTLLWVDIEGRALHRFDPATGADQVLPMPGPLSLALPRASGGLVIGMGSGLLHWRESGLLSLLDLEPGGEQVNRTNDGACDAAGRLWVGTMALDERSPSGALYRIDSELRVTRVLEGTVISNGLGWSPAGDRFYFIDTPLRRIDVFDHDPHSGALEHRRVLAETAGPGSPDGLSVDAEGCLWVAMHDGGRLRRYGPDGELLADIPLPVSRPTSCCFGGPGLRDLYVTTRRQGLSERELREQPLAGALLRLDPGVTGMPTFAFAG